MKHAHKQKTQGKIKVKEDFFPALHYYTQMAMDVGKILKKRPNEILETWGVAELIVTWGYYMDEKIKESYETYKNLDAKERGKQKNPMQYMIKFAGFDYINKEG